MVMKNIILIIISVILLASCKVDTKKNIIIAENKQEKTSHAFTENDSLLIEKLVRKVYKWNEENTTYYFNIGIEDKEGEKYTGIDWSIYEKNKKSLKNSGLFSDIFIESYRNTLEQIDKKVKNKEYEYEWFIGEYPPFGTDANEWCHCQDTPSNDYWNNIEIKDIKVTENNIVSLTWDWGKNNSWSNGFNYAVKVKKENNTWKITYLDGFDNKHY